MKEYELTVIGGGPAGMAAALAARESGIKDILILERDVKLGGILNQCIHNGFGLAIFGEELTGPEFAQRYIDRVLDEKIEYRLDTMVMDIGIDGDCKVITATNRNDGYFRIRTKALMLAMGCRERTRGSLCIPGSRPAGIFTAGTAQRLVNINGYMPGKRIVILGSGDIGLIMARRMTLEGAKVLAAVEIMKKSAGLQRNIVQCLDDFSIPLLLRHTVVDIIGKKRVEGVVVAEVDDNFKPIPGTEQTYECDCLLLSTGLIPENELTMKIGAEMDASTKGPKVNESFETTVPGVFAAGNVQAVHGLADDVSIEADRAGKAAAEYIRRISK